MNLPDHSNEIIFDRIKIIVRKYLQKNDPAHRLDHVENVVKICELIAKNKNVDLMSLKMAAYLHDIIPRKDPTRFEYHVIKSAEESERILSSLSVDTKLIKKIKKIIIEASYDTKKNTHSLEAAILADADKLDAIGARGIARVFTFGGFHNRSIDDPDINMNNVLETKKYDGRKLEETSLMHFYTKLLKLIDQMNTNEGKKLAKEKHEVIIAFLESLEKETLYRNIKVEDIQKEK